MSEQASGGRSKPSIYDVAQRAGVSHMTVSRVLNGHPSIRESTREKVLRAIEELQYTRSSIARALARRRSMRIGVIVDSAEQWGPNSTLRAIERAARGFDYSVSTFTTAGGDGGQLQEGITDLVAQGIDALCVIAPRQSSQSLVREHSANMPTLVIGAGGHDGPHTAAVDQDAGARSAVSHLIGLGHRRIAHVAGPADWHDSIAREHAWRDQMIAAGLTPEIVVAGDWTAEAGYRIGAELDVERITAVFAANDHTALGLIHAFADRGIRVPIDVSVVGFDDTPDSRHFLPPLTTVRQDFDALGALAVHRLVQAMEGIEPAHRELITPELIVRASTDRPRA